MENYDTMQMSVQCCEGESARSRLSSKLHFSCAHLAEQTRKSFSTR